MKPPAFFQHSRAELGLALGLILLVTAGLYGHTLQVPFYLDDNALFNGTFQLRDVAAQIEHIFNQRGLTNLTFALNFRLAGEWSLPALHLVNIALHAGCGLLVWCLLRRLVPGRRLPLLGALLFLAHPLQTQGVTYLTQRSTVLGAFLFLVAFRLHLQGRDVVAREGGRRAPAYHGWHLAALLAGAAAVLAKANTATLPLALFAYDRLFPREARSWRQMLGDYLPFCAIPLLFGIDAFGHLSDLEELAHSPYQLASLEHNSPLNYLVTQFSVMWVYLRLLLLPYGQALEHDYPVAAELLTLPNLVALSGLLLVGGLVWRVRRRRPLLAFGVAWFFMALAVESTIIPLDPLFEHRLYLPMFGMVLVVLDGLPAVMGERRTLLVLALALLACLPLTWRRNALWNDPVAFYEDNLRAVPDSERAMVDLAFRYRDQGLLGQHLRLLEEALRLYPKNHDFYILLAEMHADRGSFDQALALLDLGLERMPDNLKLYENAALVAEQAGRRELIFAYLQRGLDSGTVSKWRLLNDLAVYYTLYGDPRRAEQLYRQSIELHPDNPVAYQYLGGLYFTQQRWPEALAVLRQAQAIEPGNPLTLEGLGKAALQVGDRETARWVAGKLTAADPQAGRKFGEALEKAGWQ